MKAETCFADTNLFLRFLTNDLPAQADKVERLLHRARDGEVKLVTTGLVIAEIVWTLESYYQISKSEIQDKVLAILNTPGLDVENADLLLQAAVMYAEKNVDFIDAFNAAWMRERGVKSVATFDARHYSRLDSVEVRPLSSS